jgi:hypothetical protein
MARPFGQRVVTVGPAVHEKLLAIQRELAEERQRNVTYAEVVEYLVTFRETRVQIIREADR